ncbi:hypothetical protein SKA58_11373 [Sphingomonas sp. SKA58]|nr:hypothetical protein SKA58_11373 [Sphingomonas sp. SKA58]
MVGYVALVVEERVPNLGEYGVVAG